MEEVSCTKICSVCGEIMGIGKVISPFVERGTFYAFTPVVTKDNLELIDCWKCKSCGNSEEMN